MAHARSTPGCAAPTATFEVSYEGFPAHARAAFQAAVDTWSCRITSSVPIRVQARWEALAARTLGSAGPYLIRNFNGAAVPDTWVPAALADAQAGRDLTPDQPDIDAVFNASLPSWHTDPESPPPSTAYDLQTVVLHELGHGLGVIGAMSVENGRGYVGDRNGTRGPYIFDRLAEDAGGIPLLSSAYPDGSIALGSLLQEEVWVSGTALRQTGGRARLNTPSPWEEGASYSHVDEALFSAGTPDGLMTPSIGRGESIAAPGAQTCALLADLGWTLAGECASLVGALPPVVAQGLEIVQSHPRGPFSQTTEVTLRVTTPQAVSVRVVDVLGRTLASWPATLLEPGTGRTVRIDGSSWAPGVYIVIAQGDGQRQAVRIVRER